MKVIVIGSGLIGVTTAYFLRRRGHEVTVIDRKEGPGRETSFANGALLTPSMSDPWNAPGSWRVLLASLGRSDAAMQLRLRALPGLAGWGFTFLRNSRVATFERNALSNLRLAQYSLTLMQTLRQQTRINYGRATGSLRIFRDPTSLDHASALANRLSSEGLAFRRLSTAEAIELEPVLAPIANHVSGALHYAADETGDAYRFCVALADHARQQGVEFRFRTEVTSLELRSGQVMAAVSRRERFAADRYVVAAGSYSTRCCDAWVCVCRCVRSRVTRSRLSVRRAKICNAYPSSTISSMRSSCLWRAALFASPEQRNLPDTISRFPRPAFTIF